MSKLSSSNGRCSASLLTNSTLDAPISVAAARASPASGGHVDPCYPPRLADHLRRDERIRPGPRAQVEDAFTGRQPPELPRVRNARERLDGPVRDIRQLLRIAEVFCPRPPVGKMKSRSGSAETEA